MELGSDMVDGPGFVVHLVLKVVAVSVKHGEYEGSFCAVRREVLQVLWI